jgi:hypothetical protein
VNMIWIIPFWFLSHIPRCWVTIQPVAGGAMLVLWPWFDIFLFLHSHFCKIGMMITAWEFNKWLPIKCHGNVCDIIISSFFKANSSCFSFFFF